MTKEVKRWVANDNSEWDTEHKAKQRDDLLVSIQLAMAPLRPKPNDVPVDFANGYGYIQHSSEAVRKAKLALYEIARGPLNWWIKDQKKRHNKTDEQLALDIHPSWHGRMLDGSCPPLEKAYGRLMCIDKQSREWGQPYFASHPEEGEQIMIRSGEETLVKD